MALPPLSPIEKDLCRLGYKEEVIRAYVYQNPYLTKRVGIIINLQKDWDDFTCKSIFDATEEEIIAHIENEIK